MTDDSNVDCACDNSENCLLACIRSVRTSRWHSLSRHEEGNLNYDKFKRPSHIHVGMMKSQTTSRCTLMRTHVVIIV